MVLQPLPRRVVDPQHHHVFCLLADLHQQSSAPFDPPGLGRWNRRAVGRHHQVELGKPACQGHGLFLGGVGQQDHQVAGGPQRVDSPSQRGFGIGQLEIRIVEFPLVLGAQDGGHAQLHPASLDDPFWRHNSPGRPEEPDIGRQEAARAALLASHQGQQFRGREPQFGRTQPDRVVAHFGHRRDRDAHLSSACAPDRWEIPPTSSSTSGQPFARSDSIIV